MHKTITLLFGFWLYSALLTAQVCDGNFGDNIFEEGDFGSGATNVIFQNPNIAPGYNYTTSGPPWDGQYIITNNTGAWTGLYGTWLEVGDNSNDTDGYMMVVNASFSEGLFYEQTIENLCENTLYEFTADIINLIKRGVPDHIFPNVSFFLNDELQYTTGDIEQTEAWETYGFTFVTVAGQNSMKLSLRNNAPGGIGNDLALDNITFRACGPNALILPQTIANICEDGDPIELEATVNGDQYEDPVFQWQQSFDRGATWGNLEGETGKSFQHTELSAGDYYYRYLLAETEGNVMNSKCRVNSNIKIVRVVPKFDTITTSICQGLSFEVGMSSYRESGVYVDSLISSLDCDSIVTLILTVLPDQGIEADIALINPTCHDYEDASVSIQNVRNVYPPFSIMLDDAERDDGYFMNLSAGIYQLQIRDTFGCSFEQGIIIQNPDLFRIDLGDDQILDLGESTLLELDSNYPIQSLACTSSETAETEEDCFGVAFLPTSSGIYRATAISEAGCVASDSVQILVREVEKVYFPSIFSPNNDGANDFFSVFGDTPNVQRIASLQIYNRWGNLVFETQDLAPNDIKAGWDGYENNQPSESDVYVYLAEVEFLGGKVKSFYGELVLWR